MEYPKRESHFANKFCRLLLRTCAAQEIGAASCYLLVQIAHTEDAAHYRRPVTWWNDQLQSVLGMSKKQLIAARKRAIEGGWLHYERGGKGKVGKYFVTVPKIHQGLPDHAVDEDFLDLSVPSREPQEEPIPPIIGDANDTEQGTKTGPKREPIRDQKGNTFKPIPKPSPSPNKEHHPADDAVSNEEANQPKLPPGETLDDVAFYDDFWRVVPRKVGKEAAHKAFITARQKLSKLGQSPAEAREFLVERMAAFAATPKAQSQYCPHPATWLNQGRYDDDPAEWERSDGKPTSTAFKNRSGRPAVKSIEG